MVRSTTSIAMDRAVLEWVERRIEEGVFASRSHAIEHSKWKQPSNRETQKRQQPQDQ